MIATLGFICIRLSRDTLFCSFSCIIAYVSGKCILISSNICNALEDYYYMACNSIKILCARNEHLRRLSKWDRGWELKLILIPLVFLLLSSMVKCRLQRDGCIEYNKILEIQQNPRLAILEDGFILQTLKSSSTSDSRHASMAFFILSRASSTVSPCEIQQVTRNSLQRNRPLLCLLQELLWNA